MKKDISWLRNNVFSHRGLHNFIYPENSMGAFINSINYGYAIELDVQLTKDNEVIVFHDYNLKRMTGYDKDVDELTYEQIKRFNLLNTKEKIPLLKDVLYTIDKKVPVIIDIKVKLESSNISERVYEVVKDYQGKFSIQSFDPRIVEWYENNANGIIRGQISYNISYSIKKWCKSLLNRTIFLNFKNNPDYICYGVKGINNIRISILRRYMPIVSWTIKDKKEMKKALKYSDSIIFEDFLPKKYKKG